MTKRERAQPKLLQASRKKRIAKGAGLEVNELNKLMKMHRQMSDMMKKMGRMGKGGMLKQAMRGMLGKGGGMPDMNDPRSHASRRQCAWQQNARRLAPGLIRIRKKEMNMIPQDWFYGLGRRFDDWLGGNDAPANQWPYHGCQRHPWRRD